MISKNTIWKQFLLFFKPTKPKLLIVILLDVIIIAGLLFIGENIIWSDAIQGIIIISIFGYVAVGFVEAVVRYIEYL